MKTIHEVWESLEAAAIPADAPDIQRQEMRRAFYAGAQAMLHLAFSVGPESVSEDEGAAMLERWRLEVLAFSRAIREGKA